RDEMRDLIATLESPREGTDAPRRARIRGDSRGKRHRYSISGIAFCSIATTSLGSLAYESASTMFCPSLSIHCRNSLSTFFFAWSWIFDGMSNHVKLEMGYASCRAASVIDTRKSAGIVFTAPAAAAVTLARSAFTGVPALLRTLPYSILF